MDIEINRYLVVAVDAARARFFSLHDTDTPEIESGPNLVETRDIVQPENAMLDEDVFSQTKTGANVAGGNGRMHQYDDHRTRHTTEFARRFGETVIDEAHRRAVSQGARELIVVANPDMLGLIRPELDQKFKGGKINVKSVGKEVSKLSPRQIHELLSGRGFLPARRASGDHMGVRRRRA